MWAANRLASQPTGWHLAAMSDRTREHDASACAQPSTRSTRATAPWPKSPASWPRTSSCRTCCDDLQRPARAAHPLRVPRRVSAGRRRRHDQPAAQGNAHAGHAGAAESVLAHRLAAGPRAQHQSTPVYVEQVVADGPAPSSRLAAHGIHSYCATPLVTPRQGARRSGLRRLRGRTPTTRPTSSSWAASPRWWPWPSRTRRASRPCASSRARSKASAIA